MFLSLMRQGKFPAARSEPQWTVFFDYSPNGLGSLLPVF